MCAHKRTLQMREASVMRRYIMFELNLFLKLIRMDRKRQYIVDVINTRKDKNRVPRKFVRLINKLNLLG